jgi:hypothetical protein
MALTQADLERLDAAIASESLEVQMGERRIRYRTMDELIAARAHVAQQLAAASASASGTRRGTRRYTFSTARGD